MLGSVILILSLYGAIKSIIGQFLFVNQAEFQFLYSAIKSNYEHTKLRLSSNFISCKVRLKVRIKNSLKFLNQNKKFNKV